MSESINKFEQLVKKALVLETRERTQFLEQIENPEIKQKIAYLLDDDEELTHFLIHTSAGIKPLKSYKLKDMQAGDKIRQFIIVKLIAKGGMGSVYLAYDEKLKRNVAIKTIRSEFLQSTTSQKRFEQEAQILSQINHPSICQIYDYIDYDDGDLLVLELVDGETLNRLTLTDTQKLEVFIQIASALVAAHDKGIIHRDLKPDNIMLTGESQVKILDFGIAKSKQKAAVLNDSNENISDNAEDESLTRHGSLMGTLIYMSPEQAAAKEISKASDIYSLGIIMQEMLTGVSAYCIDNTEDLKQQVIEAKNANVVLIPKQYKSLIQSLTEKDPIKRPNACDVQQQLLYIKELPNSRKRKYRNILIGFVTVLLISLLIFQWYDFSQKRENINFINDATKSIDKIKSKLDFVFTLPIHNIKPELAQITKLRDNLLSSLSDNQTISMAVKNELIGRTYYANRDFERSINYLEMAWESGIQHPDLAYQLGVSYQISYNDAFSSQDSWQMTSDVDKKYLNSTLTKNRFDKSKTYFSYYESHAKETFWKIKIYEDFFNKRYHQALKLINFDELHQKADYETFDFIGTVYRNLMLEAAKNKDDALVGKYFVQALASYKNAIDYARSFPYPYKNICQLIIDKIEINIFTAKKNEMPLIQDVQSYCYQTLEIYPDNDIVINKIVAFKSRFAEYLMGMGLDAKSKLREAIQWNDKIVKKGCKSFGSRGILNDLLAEQEYESGLNPIKSIKNALSSYQNSIKHCPEEITLVTGNMYYSYMVYLKYLISQGDDLIPIMDQAEILYKTQQQSPFKREDVFGNMFSNYGDLEQLMALGSILYGENPTPWLERARESYTKSIDAEGLAPYPVGGLVAVKLLAAEYALINGELSEKQLSQITIELDEALKIGKNLHWMVLLQADLMRLKINFIHEKNKIDDILLKTADIIYQKAIEMNPKNFNSRINRAKLMLLAMNGSESKDEAVKYYETGLSELESVLLKVPNYVEAIKIKHQITLTADNLEIFLPNNQ